MVSLTMSWSVVLGSSMNRLFATNVTKDISEVYSVVPRYQVPKGYQSRGHIPRVHKERPGTDEGNKVL